MKRILCIISSLDVGGAETFMMKIFRTLDHQKYCIDFLVSTDRECAYNDEIRNLGGKIIPIIGKEENVIKNFFQIIKVVKKGSYKNVIKVSEYSIGAFDLLAAKIGGAQNRVIRSTNGGSLESRAKLFIHTLFVPWVSLVSTALIAPSKEAAKFTFGKRIVNKKKVVYLKNGVDIDSFCVSDEEKNNLKMQIGVFDKKILGHIGRFSKQKNHKFLIDIFNEYHKIYSESVLILIGVGELESDIKKQVTKYGLNDSVKFLGLRSDVSKILSIIDVVLLPSLYEGMPNVIIEAQAAGIPCVVSDTITRECNLTGEVRFSPLNKEIDNWIENIEIGRKISYEQAKKIIIQEGYSIESVTNEFLRTTCK